MSQAYVRILKEAVRIAESAAEIAKSYFRGALLIETKADATPVTVADKKTEEYIRSELTKTFPGHGILGEEFGQESMDAEFVWTVDPIDGTRSFIRGVPLFGTLLGLMHRREVVIGVMVLPVLGETYAAAKGHGAYCNGTRLQVSKTSSLESSLVSVGDVAAFETAGRRKLLEDLMDRAELTRGYTDCFGHALVLRGSVDAMLDPVGAPWDFVPLACLVEEAGGSHFTLDGGPAWDATSFISCTPALRGELEKLL